MTIPHQQPAQAALDLREHGPIARVEEYRFEPIRGYPMLQWAGKRPFTSTQYYPAQHKETHGPEVEGWRNKLYWGDNLQVMSHLLKQYRGQVQLIYIDPPFDSKADYTRKITVRGQSAAGDKSAFEEKQYTDIWTNDEYLQFMYERLILLRELLADDGSLYLHCDWHKSHHLRLALDEIFGSDNFRNEIIWKRSSIATNVSTQWRNSHDTVLFYTKSRENIFYIQYGSYTDSSLNHYRRKDERGHYRTVPLMASGKTSGPSGQPWRGIDVSERGKGGMHWLKSPNELERLDREGKIYWNTAGVPELKYYLDEAKGVYVSDYWDDIQVWDDIKVINSMAHESQDYPTQKPEALLERIIRASTNPDDLVFDCFMGSGTTQAAAMKLGRRFLGADINLGAVQITTKRLLAVAAEMQAQEQPQQRQPMLLDTDEAETSSDQPITRYTGFEVFNVNNYDVFRNPVQARDLLLEALEVNPIPAGSLFDGEKDGRMVKLMPVNRIATRQDLNDLITGFDYKALQRRQAEAPTRPVEKITLVCMGHEPDLAARLQQEMKPYLLDVEVVDILRDKQDIQFKRDSEAEIVIRDGEVVIEKFFPMTLMSKLSQQKEDASDWRELVDSVMVDWNYDGAVLEPAQVDVPPDGALVVGHYPIPASAGTIRVKITDLLSQSLEIEISRGPAREGHAHA